MDLSKVMTRSQPAMRYKSRAAWHPEEWMVEGAWSEGLAVDQLDVHPEWVGPLALLSPFRLAQHPYPQEALAVEGAELLGRSF